MTVFQENQNNEEEYHNLQDLPAMSNAEVTEFVSEELVGKVLDSRCFRFTILLLIIINSILIAVETNKDLVGS